MVGAVTGRPNLLCQHLFKEQIENFIAAAECRTFRPGEALILEGCRDDRGIDEFGHNDIAAETEYFYASPVTEPALADTDDLLDIDFSYDIVNENPRQSSTDESSLHSLDYVPPPSSGSESCLYVIRNGNVAKPTLNRGIGHIADGPMPIGCAGVHVQVAANIAKLDQFRQLTLLGPLKLFAVFT